ncbi:NRAMP (natural resistance-associated macrophage protein)-like metal ion transporter [Mesorhizobium soli]|uniref:NRAMP family divalent metal transporter n=1 Tax=Pseudaminobacter soli (ex Li et al. 2025) TaxID=1295366 RepID=UPI002476B536|nr:divalent metal cation transporter [Mesorhizobium soli]MDH6231955.1 NRAMP (natural resistance-associated macrophage protein)-like metal ion transporter [Mesorhizobium soli]
MAKKAKAGTQAGVRAMLPTMPHFLKVLGPGLITGASDDDPSGIATYSQTGAQFGYAPSWTLLYSYPLMVAIQIISAELGRTTGRGIAGNLRKFYPKSVVYGCVSLLLAANVINVGADIGAMADAVRVLIGGPQIVYVLTFGVICVVAEVYLSYDRYVVVLKWLTLALFAYLATLFFVKVDWSTLARSLVVPHVSFDKDYLTAIVAILGTTISPYLFFWQASEEVEDIRDVPKRKALKDAPRQTEAATARIRQDTFVGMGLSNLVALSIMMTAAATLHVNGITQIESSAQAAQALKPLAGVMAETIFALGIVGTGLLAVPVLAGSAAYAVGETLRWPTGLDRKPMHAKAFYATIAIATLIGVGLNFSPINPIRALYWSAVINGVVAVPIMAMMMLMAVQPRIMGKNTIGAGLRAFGWLSTAVMTLTAAAMLVTSFL